MQRRASNALGERPVPAEPDIEGREISLGEGLPKIPERLLLAHRNGEVLFVCGAGVSVPSGLPEFRELVMKVYEALDPAVYRAIEDVPKGACNLWEPNCESLNPNQVAEARRFVAGDYDVVLGMLERRLDGERTGESGDGQVRQTVRKILTDARPVPDGPRPVSPNPAPIHRAIVRLADRGMGPVVVTTNFDLLLEDAAGRLGPRPKTYALAGIPRPSTRLGYAGVFHVHGALSKDAARVSELVLSDQDFGEFYMRRRVVPDLIYDAARLYHLVLVGYSANDPPMRYLLNAVAADDSRFSDIKERFSFIGAEERDPASLADWRGRGITPIHYDSANGHEQLRAVLERWARLFAVNGEAAVSDREARRIVRRRRADATDADRELFDHLLRRNDSTERARLLEVANGGKADMGWLDAAARVEREGPGGIVS